MVRTKTVRGVPYYTAHVVVPKELADGMRLRGGTPVFLSAVACRDDRRRSLLVLLGGERMYPDDVPSRITEHVTKRTGKAGAVKYASTVLSIPKVMVTRLGLQRGDTAKMARRGAAAIAVSFERRGREGDGAAAGEDEKAGA